MGGRPVPAHAERAVHVTVGVRSDGGQDIELVKARDTDRQRCSCAGSSRGAPRGAGTCPRAVYDSRGAGGEAQLLCADTGVPRGDRGTMGPHRRTFPELPPESVHHAGAHAGHNNAQRLAGDPCERPHSGTIPALVPFRRSDDA